MAAGEIVVEVSDGARRVRAWCRWVGEDLVVAVGGGERPHVGCVVLAQSRPSTREPGLLSVSSSVLTIPPHKEEPVARGIAERLARELGCTVVTTAGIHDDGLGAAGARGYLDLAGRLADDLLATLRGR